MTDPKLYKKPKYTGHRAGKRKCLKCDKVFHSWDKIDNRICPTCAKSNESGLPDHLVIPPLAPPRRGSGGQS